MSSKWFLFLFSLSLATAVPLAGQGKALANDFIDQLLANLSELMLSCGLDPMDLEDAVIGFDWEIIGIPIGGHIGLTEGFATGMSSLVRDGDAYLDIGETTVLTAPIMMTNVAFGYTLHIDFLGFEVNPSASVSIEAVDIDLEAEAELIDLNLKVTKLNIHNIRGMDIDIDALGPLDFILEFLAGIIGNFVKGIIANIMEGPIRWMINRILEDPGSGGDGSCFPGLVGYSDFPSEPFLQDSRFSHVRVYRA